MWFFKKKPAQEAVVQPEIQQEPAADQPGFFEKVKTGLSKSSAKIGQGITDIFTKKKLDAETLQELQDLLITADMGPATAEKLTAALSKNRFGEDIPEDEIRRALAAEIAAMLQKGEKPFDAEGAKPFVVLVAGVNGAGKTTTIGKLAHHLKSEGKSVMLAAGDTFRAAAVEQLKVWGQRVGCPVIAKAEGADAAALAFEAVEEAQRQGTDILLIDTAGRLQNKANLMEELSKVVRVIRKKIPAAPHATLLVLDATVGQNAHSQVEQFNQIVPISGLILTKLDGTAKGGVVVSLVERFGLPVHAIGVGEAIDDLRPFAAQEFAYALMGLEQLADRK